jgi:threonyl-tRNA synthetase
MTNISITLPDGSSQEYENGVTGQQIAESISEGLARAAVAVKVDGTLYDLTRPITTDASVEIVTFDSDEGTEIFRHTTAHIFAQALLRKFPKAKIAIGPAIEQGFYYDFDLDGFTEDDMRTIEDEMKAIVKEKLPIERQVISKEEARKLFADNPYKLEMIEELPDDSITAYKQGDFIDLCRGPHLPNTGKVKALKLTKVAGAYWRGNSENKMLNRVYGISFPDKKQLKEYLHLLEEAQRRDHKKIGKEMELFTFHDEAPGMPFFHDKGSFIWNSLVAFTTQVMERRSYQLIRTPLILNKSLWLQSGHWDHYKDNMYFTMIDNQEYAVKPMNCPGHIVVYKSRMHSYRELPIRGGEFGLVHRHEMSGVLNGLFRVRCFTQDDAHIYCTQDQLKDELRELLSFVKEIYETFGFEYHLELSTRPEKSMGDPKLWDKAESILKEVLEESEKEYVINEGDGAFYGPKIDAHLKDALGRTWQCGTIQVDFQMPEKFDLTYEGQDGQKHRPVMVHRAILGSVERFMGILVEHFAGKFPLWISPAQVKVLTITDRNKTFAQEVVKRLKDEHIRVELDDRAATVGKKIRDAEIEHFNYILVLGDTECEKKVVNVRTRDNEILGEQSVDDFVAKLKAEIASKGKE